MEETQTKGEKWVMLPYLEVTSGARNIHIKETDQ